MTPMRLGGVTLFLGWNGWLADFLTKFFQLTSLNFYAFASFKMAAFSREDSNPPPTLVINMDNLAGLDHLYRVVHCNNWFFGIYPKSH